MNTISQSKSDLIEYYVNSEMPSFEVFLEKIKKELNFDITEDLKVDISKICEAGELTKKDINNMIELINSIRGFENRKQQADYINLSYKKTNKSNYLFCILDGKDITNKQKIEILKEKLIEL